MKFNHVEISIENTGEFYKHFMSTTSGWKEERGVKIVLEIGTFRLEFYVGCRGDEEKGYKFGISGAISGYLLEISDTFKKEELHDELEQFIDDSIIQHLINSDMDFDRAIAIEEQALKKAERQWGKRPEPVRIDSLAEEEGSWI